MKNENLNVALHYADLNFSVIPIGDKKVPLVKWERYAQERATKGQIKKFWAQFPNANVGIVTGKISGIVVVDVEKGGSVKDLPPTVISKTGGGGWHYFYKYPDSLIKNSVRIKDLTDIRGDGGYVIAPPSVHHSGKRYEWIVSPDDADFAELPLWVLEESKKIKKIDWKEFLSSNVGDGFRNATATQIAGKVLYHLPLELWELSGWATLKEWNQLYVNPPLDRSELRLVFDSILGRELSRRKELSGERGKNE